MSEPICTCENPGENIFKRCPNCWLRSQTRISDLEDKLYHATRKVEELERIRDDFTKALDGAPKIQFDLRAENTKLKADRDNLRKALEKSIEANQVTMDIICGRKDFFYLGYNQKPFVMCNHINVIEAIQLEALEKSKGEA